jgi:hypothetical protein
MKHSLKQLYGYKIRGKDGEIGEVFDFYFDDADWTVRYVVVETGNWLSGRKVLLSPTVAGRPQWAEHHLPVSLTKEQIVNSPPIDADKPVDRQYEELLNAYYGWPLYWMGYPAVPVMVGPVLENAGPQPAQDAGKPGTRREQAVPSGDPHLRSARDVAGYRIQALDDAIGNADDFVVDTETWIIRYMVVDTGNWLPGRKVLLAPGWVDAVDWGQRSVNVSMSTAQVKSSPEFDPTSAVNREYEAQLYDYYGRPKYW